MVEDLRAIYDLGPTGFSRLVPGVKNVGVSLNLGGVRMQLPKLFHRQDQRKVSPLPVSGILVQVQELKGRCQMLKIMDGEVAIWSSKI